MRVAVYERVSTDRQDVASQAFVVQGWLDARGITEVRRFQDKQSGKNDDRPGLLAMCAAIEAGEIDTVVVYRLDRLSRKAVTALRLILDWLQGGISFYAVDQPALSLGIENPLRLTIAAVFSDLAQLEREAIVSRVRSGLKAAKARGVKLGPKPKVSEELRQEILRLREYGQPCRTIAESLGLSKSTISRVGAKQ